MELIDKFLPFVREKKVPLFAGFLWLFYFWLIARDSYSENDYIKSLVVDVSNLSLVILSFSLSFCAYLVGSGFAFLLESFFKVPDSRLTTDTAKKLFTEAHLRLQLSPPFIIIVLRVLYESEASKSYKVVAGIVCVFLVVHGLALWDLAKSEPLISKPKKSDLSNACVLKVNGRYTNFEKVNLTNASLSASNFTTANFREANLSGTSLSKSDFSGSNFTRANLSYVNQKNKYHLFPMDLIRRVAVWFFRRKRARNDFIEADLRGVNLINASLAGANFTNAELQVFECSKGEPLHKVAIRQEADLRGADFTGSNFTGANLKEADFRDAILRGADFTDTNIGSAKLKGSKWDKSTIWPEGFIPPDQKR